MPQSSADPTAPQWEVKKTGPKACCPVFSLLLRYSPIIEFHHTKQSCRARNWQIKWNEFDLHLCIAVKSLCTAIDQMILNASPYCLDFASNSVCQSLYTSKIITLRTNKPASRYCRWMNYSWFRYNMSMIDRPCAMITEMLKLTTHHLQRLEQSDPSMPRDTDFARLSWSKFICFLVNSNCGSTLMIRASQTKKLEIRRPRSPQWVGRLFKRKMLWTA